jgi:hypothetical protein
VDELGDALISDDVGLLCPGVVDRGGLLLVLLFVLVPLLCMRLFMSADGDVYVCVWTPEDVVVAVFVRLLPLGFECDDAHWGSGCADLIAPADCARRCLWCVRMCVFVLYVYVFTCMHCVRCMCICIY